MKKIILPVALSLFTLTSALATTKTTTPTKIETRTFNISTFCKLIQMGDYDAVKSLIDAGENVNQRSNGLTPLMFAARHNKADIAKLLIQNGAKLKAKTDRGITALKLAERSKAKDAYKVIKAALDK